MADDKKIKKNTKICPVCQDWTEEDKHLVDKECKECKDIREQGGIGLISGVGIED